MRAQPQGTQQGTQRFGESLAEPPQDLRPLQQLYICKTHAKKASKERLCRHLCGIMSCRSRTRTPFPPPPSPSARRAIAPAEKNGPSCVRACLLSLPSSSLLLHAHLSTSLLLLASTKYIYIPIQYTSPLPLLQDVATFLFRPLHLPPSSSSHSPKSLSFTYYTHTQAPPP